MFLVVTDSELLASKYVTLIFLILVFIGILINIIQFKRSEIRSKRIRKVIFLTVLLCLVYPIYCSFDIDSRLLNDAEYTTGTTKEYCSVFAKGEGVRFEYKVNGEVYSKCNTFHPIPKANIIVPNGKYRVRYTEKYPAQGRIDFHKRIEQ